MGCENHLPRDGDRTHRDAPHDLARAAGALGGAQDRDIVPGRDEPLGKILQDRLHPPDRRCVERSDLEDAQAWR